jgi:tetratricopeptide (TPR) repeat protein
MIRYIICFCLAIPPQLPEPQVSQEAAALVQAGAEAEHRHDLDAAISDYRRAAELAPSSAIVFLKLGNAYMQKRDFDAAIPPLKKAAELSSDALPVRQLLGFALLTRGYAAEAIPHLEAAHEFGALGIAQLQNNQPAEAVENLQRALAKSPGDPDLLYYLGRAGSAVSEQAVDLLLSSSPDSARSHQALGQNYFSMKMYDRAKQEYAKAVALRPDLPGVRLELGQVCAATSKWEEAEEQFRAEVAVQPGNAEAAYRLGDTLLQEGKMKEAVAELQRSSELRPDMPETLYALGRAATMSDPPLAEKALGRLIELEKDTSLAGQAYLGLAEIHRKLGKTQTASEEMQEFRRIQSLHNSRSSHP